MFCVMSPSLSRRWKSTGNIRPWRKIKLRRKSAASSSPPVPITAPPPSDATCATGAGPPASALAYAADERHGQTGQCHDSTRFHNHLHQLFPLNLYLTLNLHLNPSVSR